MKADRIKYWMEQETLNVKKYLQGGKDRTKVDPDGNPLTVEDYIILGNIDNAIGGSANHMKFLMDMRYGVSQSGSGEELSGTKDNQINVSFGTRD